MKTFIFCIALLTQLLAFAQQGEIRGTVTNFDSKDPYPTCRISISSDSITFVVRALTDLEGNYSLTGLQSGTYFVKVSNEIEGVIEQTKKVAVSSNQATILNFEVESNLQELQVVMVVSSRKEREKQSAINIEGIQMSSTGAPVNASSASGNSKGSRNKRNQANNSVPFENNANYNDSRYNTVVDNTFVKVKTEPLSTFSIDVDNGSYTNVRNYIQNGSMPPANAVREEEMINYFKYAYSQPSDQVPFSVTTEYTDCPWNSKNKLVHIGIQGAQLDLEEAPESNLVFLIDVSGSMEGSDKLELIKTGLLMLVKMLGERDKIAIVTYSGSAELALPSTSCKHKDQIESIISQLRADGSTNGSDAIQMAYQIAKKEFKENGNNRVILATDGDFNVGISDQSELVKLIEEKRDSGIYLSVIGVGTGNFQEGTMEQLADHGNGNFFYFDNVLEAKRMMVEGMTGLLYTIAKDVKLQVEFNPEFVKSYRLIGYANRKLAAEDFNDDKKDAGEIGAGHSVTALYEIVPAGTPDEIRPNIDPLKYQKETESTSKALSNELFTLKIRYKLPDENTSNLITHICEANSVAFAESSENCQFAASVAEFGMLLRNSEFKKDASFEQVIKIAKSNKGADVNGDRAEFIKLVERAELMHETEGSLSH